MRSAVRSTLIMAIAGGVAAIAALLFGVDRTDLVLDAYLVFVAALLALAAARIAAAAFPRPRNVVSRMLARQTRRYATPESLARIEDTIALAQADAFALHYGLRPLLAEIAATGRQELTAPTWDLVRPDRPRPEGAGVRGIETKDLAAIVDELETILPP